MTRIILAIGSIAVFFALAASAIGQNNQAASGHSGLVTSQTVAGLTISVDSRWLDAPGYRPIRISITPTAAVTADRDLLIILSTRRYYDPRQTPILSEKHLTIPENTAAGQSIETTIYFPPSIEGTDCELEIIDPSTPKGTIVKQMQVFGGAFHFNDQDASLLYAKYPHILFCDKVPDTNAIVRNLPQLQQYVTQPNQGGAPAGSGPQGMPTPAPNTNIGQPIANIQLPSAMSLAMADLPGNWLDYSSLDILCFSLDQWAACSDKNPAAHKAILQWVQAGGNLWIYSVTGPQGKWDRISELEKLLELSAAESADKNADSPTGWIKPSEDAPAENPPNYRTSSPQYPYEEAMTTPPPAELPSEEEKSEPKPAVLFREYGMGTVAAISSPDPFSGSAKWTSAGWQWFMSTLSESRWRWNLRHGNTLGNKNPDFWKFLIPGVGMPPIKTFQVFITIFVIGIGPVNYWFLKRRKKLHFMILTVPLSAAVVTSLLFSYALLADGLGTRVRARSITRLDQKRGEAATWTWLSYYSGIAPSGGLTFSSDTAVYPVLDEPDFDARSKGRKKIVWDDNQQLAQGWLDSRTPTQYLTVRSMASKLKLNVAEKAKSGVLEVENLLGAKIDYLMIRGRDGKFYLAENVGPNSKNDIQESTSKATDSFFTRLLEYDRLAEPEELKQMNHQQSQSMNYYRYNYYYRFLEETPMSVSLLNSSWALFPDSPSNFPRAGLLTPGSYIALLPECAEVELGTPSAREEASVHVIVGEW
jgi:hypothetical protein